SLNNGDGLYQVTPSSRHAGGFVVAFADGHVTFVSDTLDYDVYARIMTSNGKAARLPGEQLPRDGNNRPVPSPVWQRLPVSESAYEGT
ncbi:MAG: H-X9-DG-CTERM domain-containing protein, partial [Planctomycetota bacterium]